MLITAAVRTQLTQWLMMHLPGKDTGVLKKLMQNREKAVAGEDGDHFALLYPVPDRYLALGYATAAARRPPARQTDRQHFVAVRPPIQRAQG